MGPGEARRDLISGRTPEKAACALIFGQAPGRAGRDSASGKRLAGPGRARIPEPAPGEQAARRKGSAGGGGFARALSLLAGLVFSFAVSGCDRGGGPAVSGGAGDPAARTPKAVEPLEEWRLSEAPSLDLGVREGPEPYQLHRALGSVRLEDGRVAVLNGGTRELRFFDAAGRFLFSVGREGEGPGEFKAPVTLRRDYSGSLLVWDSGLRRVSLFSSDGEFLQAFPLTPSREVIFPGDEWLYGRNWVVSPIPPSGRPRLRVAIDALPAPYSGAGLRVVRLSRQGRLWTSDEEPAPDSPRTWKVFDEDGALRARVVTPPGFELHEIGTDYVTGRRLGEFDVNHVQVFSLLKPEGSADGPGLGLFLTTPQAAQKPPADSSAMGAERPGSQGESPTSGPEDEDASGPDEDTTAKALSLVKSIVKNLATLQEIHYAEHYTYTGDAKTLLQGARAPLPDGLEVDIPYAGTDGWIGVVVHEESGVRCALSYGGHVPMGWAPGTIACF